MAVGIIAREGLKKSRNSRLQPNDENPRTESNRRVDLLFKRLEWLPAVKKPDVVRRGKNDDEKGWDTAKR